MNPIKIVLIGRVLPILLLTLPIASQAQKRLVTASELQAEDGDTIIVSIDQKAYKIQLNGIDAPEDSDNPKLKVDLSRTRLEKGDLLAMGKLATEHLRFLISQNAPLKLHFNPAEKDRYGRIPGDLLNSDGLSLSELMVKNGFAIINSRSSSEELLQRLKPLQLDALAEGKGLWGHNSKASHAWAGIKESH